MQHMLSEKYIGSAIAVVLICIGLFSSFFIINPGERGLVVRLGQLRSTTFEPGLHFKLPFIDSYKTMNVQTQKIQIDCDAASKDQQTVIVTLALNYRIDPRQVGALYQNVGTNDIIEYRIIDPSIQDSVKASTAGFTAEELITKRKMVSDAVASSLTTRLQKQGIDVVDVSIVNYEFSEEFNKAIENKVRAEQEALAEKNRLEKTKYEAQQRIEQSKAEAEAIRIQAQAITSQGGAEYVNLQRIQKRDGKLPATMMGEGNGVLLNLTR